MRLRLFPSIFIIMLCLKTSLRQLQLESRLGLIDRLLFCFPPAGWFVTVKTSKLPAIYCVLTSTVCPAADTVPKMSCEVQGQGRVRSPNTYHYNTRHWIGYVRHNFMCYVAPIMQCGHLISHVGHSLIKVRLTRA